MRKKNEKRKQKNEERKKKRKKEKKKKRKKKRKGADVFITCFQKHMLSKFSRLRNDCRSIWKAIYTLTNKAASIPQITVKEKGNTPK